MSGNDGTPGTYHGGIPVETKPGGVESNKSENVSNKFGSENDHF